MHYTLHAVKRILALLRSRHANIQLSLAFTTFHHQDTGQKYGSDKMSTLRPQHLHMNNIYSSFDRQPDVTTNAADFGL